MAYRFEPLDTSRHDRAGFHSAVGALNIYLQQQARKDVERFLAATFVMVDEAAPTVIVGFYSLSNFTIGLGDLPANLAIRLPRYPRLPATLIGRLARDERFPGTGELLLVDALTRAYGLTSISGSIAVVAEAKNDTALRFYHKHGFLQLGAEPNRVYLAMGTIEKLVRPAG
jgi:hypothetical protein